MRYSLVFGQTTVSSVVDIFELLAPTAKSMRLARMEFYSKKTSTEQVRVQLARVTGAPTSGSGGSTVTPRGKSTLYSDPSLTAEIFNTTQISGGTSTILGVWGWQLSQAFIWIPSDEIDKHSHEGATRLVLSLLDAPAAATNMYGTVDIDVVG